MCATCNPPWKGPLVSIVTPTWQRTGLLAARCIPSVQDQDYRGEIEHVIVSDGPDATFTAVVAGITADAWGRILYTTDSLPAHDPVPHWGHHARRRGCELAAGEFIGYCDDDDALRPQHVLRLARALYENPDAGFAYSRMASHATEDVVSVIGDDEPACGSIGTPMIMHRREILELGTWDHASVVEDWDLVWSWLQAGVTYVKVPEETIDVWPSVFHRGQVLSVSDKERLGRVAPGTGPLIRRLERDPAALRMIEDPSVSNVQAAQYLGVHESSIRNWRKVHRTGGYEDGYARNSAYRTPDSSVTISTTFGPEERQKLHNRLDIVLDEANLTPERIKGLRISQWENVMRGSDGEPQVTQLQGIKLDVTVNEIAPAWPLIDRPEIKLVTIPPGTPRPPHSKDKVAVILPDPQIGFRQFENGELDPFHDDAAIDVAMQITEDVNPDQVICLGDFQDYAEFSRFLQEPAFARTTQHGIDRGHEFLARLSEAAPNSKKKVMEGNHDVRAEKRIRETNMAAWGLRRAGDTTGWPVMSVPYLCAFDDFGIEYIPGYPAGAVWINDRLRCIHGLRVRSSGSTASLIVKDEGVSTIFGHVHRIEIQYLTEGTRRGGRTRVAMTPGCLCRINGSVPSVRSGIDLLGRPVPAAENWQNGLGVVEYRDGESSFAIHPIYINTMEGYETRFSGKIYFPRKKSVGKKKT